MTTPRHLRTRPTIAAVVSSLAASLFAGQAVAAECTVRTVEIASPSVLECTIETIDACTLNDPAEAERILLADIGDGQDAGALYRLAQYYHNAPPLFRDPVLALWYIGRAASLGYEPAINGLTEMQPAPTAVVAIAAAAESPPQTVPADLANQTTFADPPSTLTGVRLTIEDVMVAAYAAGFCTETQLLAAVSIAIAESSLWSAARNWKPENGFRPASDYIGVQGPPEAWVDGRQMHSDRGLWQISSLSWSTYTDHDSDDPMRAAEAAFALSAGGTNFSIWDSFLRGGAQRLYDRSHDGWPALRPIVQAFLSTAGN
jgi:hypothetical protein